VLRPPSLVWMLSRKERVRDTFVLAARQVVGQLYRNGSDTRQTTHTIMRRGMMQSSKVQRAWERAVAARWSNVVCCSWEEPVRRQGDVGDAGAADGRRAQQQGLEGVDIATEASGRAGRWAVVGSSDGLRFEEERSRRRALSHCCNADWPDVRARRDVLRTTGQHRRGSL